MNERLLQYLWQFRYFNSSELMSVCGKNIQLIHQGTVNTNQGPDFSEGKVIIDGTLWIGSIELHLKTSDWNRHQHDTDSNYNNVILHVVWEHDCQFKDSVPVLELRSRVPKVLLEKYEQLLYSQTFIPCENSFDTLPEIIVSAWLDRMAVERIEQKAQHTIKVLEATNNHWEETFWRSLARNFGYKVNAEVFFEMAETIPLTVVSKHKNQIHQLEALLMGQVGLLNHRFSEAYPNMLKKEYKFLRKKYGLSSVSQPVFFLRMRPQNFPTLRLAQLAMLIHESKHLFSFMKNSKSLDDARCALRVTANDYWHYHYRFDEKTTFAKKHLGEAMISNIITNTIIPTLYGYGSYHKDRSFCEKAVTWMHQLAAENNAITKPFSNLGIKNKNAWISQALIQLKSAYCDQKRCLDCAIGNALLKT